jgi:hypothetical protein
MTGVSERSGKVLRQGLHEADQGRQALHVTRSMSRKAGSPDSARCEGFLGTPESDFSHGTDWRGVTFAGFRERLGTHIEWHGGGKPKKALGWGADEGAPRGAGLRGVAVVRRNVRGSKALISARITINTKTPGHPKVPRRS